MEFRRSAYLLIAVVALVEVRIINGEDDWLVVVRELDQTATLSCDLGTFPNGSTPRSWMFPNMSIVFGGYSDRRVTVTEDANNMTIEHVTREDLGLYHCMMIVEVNGEPRTFMNRIGLNLRGPYFDNLTKKYETNVIIGVTVTLGFLVLAGMMIAAWAYRWELRHPPLEDTNEPKANGAFYQNEAYVAYVSDEAQTDTLKKLPDNDYAEINSSRL